MQKYYNPHQYNQHLLDDVVSQSSSENYDQYYGIDFNSRVRTIGIWKTIRVNATSFYTELKSSPVVEKVKSLIPHYKK